MDAIVAVYSDWGIGENGTQPVVIPEDRRHFAELTAGCTVIVGRRTLMDFPGGRPLSGRRNIVITRSAVIEGAEAARTPEAAVQAVSSGERVFVLGGASVFLAMFPHLDRVFVTKIEDAPHSDVFFPNLDADPDWRLSDAGERLQSKNGLFYRFCVYERNKGRGTASRDIDG